MSRIAGFLIIVMSFSIVISTMDISPAVALVKKKKKKKKAKAKKPRTRSKNRRGATSRARKPGPTKPTSTGRSGSKPKVTFKLPANHGRVMKQHRADRALRESIGGMVDPRAIEAGNFALANRQQIHQRRASFQQEQNLRNTRTMRTTNRDGVRLDPDQLAAALRREKAMQEARQVKELIERGNRARDARRGSG